MEEARTEQPIVQSVSSVGVLLREAREARGLSVEEIAERVKFSVRQVEALEHDDMEHLPQGTFLRGFIRSYARVLGLDEDALLRATHTRTEHHFDVGDVQDGGTPLPVAGSSLIRSRYLLLGALLVACVLLVFVWMQAGEETSPVEPALVTPAASAPVPASAVSEAAEALSSASAEPEHKAEAVKATAQPSEPVKAVAEKKSASVDAPQPKQVAAKPAEPSLVPPSSTAIPLEQLRKRPIHIEFVEESWMEIKDVNGELLLSRITPAGDEKWVGGGNRAPYQVTIGKAGAVRLYYHGKQVDLSHFNPAGVAKLVLE